MSSDPPAELALAEEIKPGQHWKGLLIEQAAVSEPSGCFEAIWPACAQEI